MVHLQGTQGRPHGGAEANTRVNICSRSEYHGTAWHGAPAVLIRTATANPGECSAGIQLQARPPTAALRSSSELTLRGGLRPKPTMKDRPVAPMA